MSNKTMKAIVYERYGPPEVLHKAEVAKPRPKAKEVLIRIHATTVTAEDPKQRAFAFPPLLTIPVGIMFGFFTPKIKTLGFELSGEVEAVGASVSKFKVGDQVYGYTGLSFGAYAEYKCMREDSLLVRKPSEMSFQEAAATPNGAMTALVYLQKFGKIKNDDKVLIYGASGAVGTAAVQIAKSFGAHVTGVCSSRNKELVLSLGAEDVIDYTQQDFTTMDQKYDIIFDTIGKISWSATKRVLNSGGRFLVTEFGLSDLCQMQLTKVFGGQRIIGIASNLHWGRKDLETLNQLYEEGKFRPVIDRSYPLDEVVEAHKYVEQGHKKGNVVLTVIDEE